MNKGYWILIGILVLSFSLLGVSYFYGSDIPGDPYWYSLETANPSILTTGLDMELGSKINITANLTGYNGLVCVDIDHPSYGVNYSCGTPSTNFIFNITYFRNNQLLKDNFCYQETANKTTTGDGSCGLNYSGNYNLTGWIPVNTPLAYDGNWSTSASLLNDGYMYINYSKPILALDNSVWRVKDWEDQIDITLPNNCFKQNILQLKIFTDGDYTNYSCWNGTSFLQIYSHATAIGVMYEEAILWRIEPTVNSSTLNISWANGGNQTIYITQHQYDEIINASINITNFVSNGTIPTNLKIYINNSLSNVIEENTFVNTFNDSSSSKEINFSISKTQILYLKIPKGANVIYSYINLTGNKSFENLVTATTAMSYWNFNEGNGTIAYDSRGINNWTVVSSAGWTSKGKLGNAVNLSNSSQYYSIPDNTKYEFPNTMNFSIAFWINTTYGGNDIILDKDSNAGWSIQTHNGKMCINAGNILSCSASMTPHAGIYAHVVFNVLDQDDGNVVNIYINGALSGTGTSAGRTYSTGVLSIGQRQGATFSGFIGYIDELGIWNRSLNTTEINDLYTNINPLYPTNLSLEVGLSDGNPEWNYTGTFNLTNNKTSNFNLSIMNYLVNCTRDSFNFCNIPMYFTSVTNGNLLISDIQVNYTSNPNPIYLNTILIQSFLGNSTGFANIPIRFESSKNGTLQISDIKLDYLGGNKTYQILVHNSTYKQNETLNITTFYSKWDYNFPKFINYLEFIPTSPTSKSVQPYGQTSSKPIFNFTTLNYGGRNANLFIYLNGTENTSCVSLYASTNNTKPSSSLWDGLVGYWSFDIDARDLSGNGNNGSVTGAVFNSTGYLGGDYDFNGSSKNIINLENSTMLKPTNNISISAWFRINNNSGNNLFTIMVADDPDQGTGPYNGYWLAIDNRTNKGALWWEIGNGSNARNNFQPIVDFNKNQWYYLVAEYTTSGPIVYINGTNASSFGTYIGSINYSNTNVTIGRRVSTYPMNGSIDEVRIYNRSLNSSEILELYTRSSNKYYDVKLRNDWILFGNNKEFSSDYSNSKLWTWADYNNCSYPYWSLFNPDIYIRNCCIDCICSETLT